MVLFSSCPFFYPVWKYSWARLMRQREKFTDLTSSTIQAFQQRLNRSRIGRIPLRGNIAGKVAEHIRADFGFQPSEPGFEIVHPAYSFIDWVYTVEAPKRGIRKIPFRAVKTHPLVDHYRAIDSVSLLARKYHLATIGVAGPLVKDQHPAKVRDVGKTGEETIRQ